MKTFMRGLSLSQGPKSLHISREETIRVTKRLIKSELRVAASLETQFDRDRELSFVLDVVFWFVVIAVLIGISSNLLLSFATVLASISFVFSDTLGQLFQTIIVLRLSPFALA